MKIRYPEMGICGLSCQLCPKYHTDSNSRCEGCKSESRMTLGCPFITCAIKKKEIEFCWECKYSINCEKWRKHREAGRKFDSFKCYQKLEDDINFIQENGFEEYKKLQNIREEILKDMLGNYNEGRSKSFWSDGHQTTHELTNGTFIIEPKINESELNQWEVFDGSGKSLYKNSIYK